MRKAKFPLTFLAWLLISSLPLLGENELEIYWFKTKFLYKKDGFLPGLATRLSFSEQNSFLEIWGELAKNTYLVEKCEKKNLIAELRGKIGSFLMTGLGGEWLLEEINLFYEGEKWAGNSFEKKEIKWPIGIILGDYRNSFFYLVGIGGWANFGEGHKFYLPLVKEEFEKNNNSWLSGLEVRWRSNKGGLRLDFSIDYTYYFKLKEEWLHLRTFLEVRLWKFLGGKIGFWRVSKHNQFKNKVILQYFAGLSLDF